MSLNFASECSNKLFLNFHAFSEVCWLPGIVSQQNSFFSLSLNAKDKFYLFVCLLWLFKENNISCLPVHTPRWPCQLGLSQAKSWKEELSLDCHCGWPHSTTWAIICDFPGYILIGSWKLQVNLEFKSRTVNWDADVARSNPPNTKSNAYCSS